MPHTSLTRAYWLGMISVVIVAAVGRALLLAGDSLSFHSDEAIVGLMARHILAGDPPTFFYGQAYMGSLDAWLVALGFRLFAESVATIRLVQALLYLGVVASAYAAAHALLRRLDAALIVGLLFAIGTPLLTLYTAATLGGYNETLLFGHLLLALALGGWRTRWRWALVGLIAGVAWWTNALIVVYIAPLVVVEMWRAAGLARQTPTPDAANTVGAQVIAPPQPDTREIGDTDSHHALRTTHRADAPWRVPTMVALGFVVGSAPWSLYALQNDLAPIRFFLPDVLGGRETVGAVIPSVPWDQRLIGLFLLGLPSAVGLRFPWAGDFFAPLVGLVVVAVYVAALWAMARGVWRAASLARDTGLARQTPTSDDANAVGAQYIAPLHRDGDQMGDARSHHAPRTPHPTDAPLRVPTIVFLMIAFLCALFLLTRFSSDPSGRYFVPLAFPLAVALAAWAVRLPRAAMLLVVALVLGYHAAGQIVAARSEVGFTTQFVAQTHLPNDDDQALIDFMGERGLRHGYTSYWISFRIAFLSGEEIQMSAALPDKSDLAYTPAFDRYPPYRRATDASQQVAYVTANIPELDAALVAHFDEQGVTYETGQVGIFRVYYDFAPRVPRPDAFFN